MIDRAVCNIVLAVAVMSTCTDVLCWVTNTPLIHWRAIGNDLWIAAFALYMRPEREILR